VTGVADRDPLPAPQHLVAEAQRDPAGFDELGAHGQLVVEEGGAVVLNEGLDHDKAEAAPFEFLVGEARVAQPLDAADLEVGEVVGVVDVSLGVYLRVADPENRLADYGFTGR